ncbi:hypothetical protein ACFWZW_03510 [Microbacterium enclense]
MDAVEITDAELDRVAAYIVREIWGLSPTHPVISGNKRAPL